MVLIQYRTLWLRENGGVLRYKALERSGSMLRHWVKLSRRAEEIIGRFRDRSLFLATGTLRLEKISDLSKH